MPEVIVALGSNLGERLGHLRAAADFLAALGRGPLRFSRIYESEAVGPGTRPFLNAAVALNTTLMPLALFAAFKEFEVTRGRDPMAERWSDRPIDLDLIGWGRRQFRNARLTVPHASYRDRLFVLLPLRDVSPSWTDPATGLSVDEMIELAPEMAIFPIDLKWPHV